MKIILIMLAAIMLIIPAWAIVYDDIQIYVRTPMPLVTDEPVRFMVGIAPNENYDFYKISWDYGDGNVDDDKVNTGKSHVAGSGYQNNDGKQGGHSSISEHVYKNPGHYDVTAKVIFDDEFEVEDTKTIYVAKNIAKEFSFSVFPESVTIDLGQRFRSVVDFETETAHSLKLSCESSIKTKCKIYPDEISPGRSAQVFIYIYKNAEPGEYEFTVTGEVKGFEETRNIHVTVQP